VAPPGGHRRAAHPPVIDRGSRGAADRSAKVATGLRSERLQLRPWRPADLPHFAAINADPRVMEFFPARLDRAESDRLARRIQRDLATRGFGL
jgi:RimJ/RimL family protein N-acetyltransferase